MAKFKVIPLIDLAQVIPGWKEMALKSQLDMDNFTKMLEALDSYGEQNGLKFFQLHNRRIDNSMMVIFTLKE
ncbi:MAG: hypothetical protein IAF38_07385 [Bacteroidia bacterium]|nr:hypothetical protein [Bacteroidia bacterium]